MAGWGSRQGDSAGVPWAGRSLAAQPFAGDDGSADPALTAALARWGARAGRGSERSGLGSGSTGLGSGRTGLGSESTDPGPELFAAVVAAWAPSRALVPVVAVLADGADTPLTARDGDAGADMALATLVGADGRRGLPAFSSVEAAARWDSRARPVPVEAARAAQAAVAEDCQAVIVDVAGPVPCVLPRSVVWAVAQGRSWVPPHRDPDVLAAVAAACADVAEVSGHGCRPGGGAGVLELEVRLPPGLGQAALGRLIELLQVALGRREVIGERLEGLRLRPLPAAAPP
jgi:hypothetical protein